MLAGALEAHAQPTLAFDATIEAVYTLDQLPLGGSAPHVVQAMVRNVGQNTITSLGATLQVIGGTTFSGTATFGALAPGASTLVSFPAFSPASVGPQSLLVSLDNDDDTSNNNYIVSQEVTPATASYVTPGVGNQTNLGFQGAVTGAFVARFSVGGPRDVTAVRGHIADVNSVGQTMYAVVIDPVTGALLGRTPDYVVQGSDINTLHTFTFTTPTTLAGGDFLAGLAQVSDGVTQYYPMGLQREQPTRAGAFYSLVLPAVGMPYDISAQNFGKLMLEVVTTTPATCPSPRNVLATATSSSATLTFAGPANATGYEVKYGVAGFDPASTGTPVATVASPVTITGLQASTRYDFYVRTICGASDQSTWAGPVSLTTPCTPPIITSFPYGQSFDVIAAGQALPCGITVMDTNGDTNSWQAKATVAINTNPMLPIGRGGSGNAMVYTYNADNATIGGDDWFFTPALRLTAGQHYRVSFYYRSAGSAYPEALEVSYGAAASAAAQTSMLYTNNRIINSAYLASNAAVPVVADMVPLSTGVYYVGFHAISVPDQNFLAVDDVSISGVLATSSALARALSIFPNPSASGRFNVEVRGANASQGLGIEVVNMLGQRMYTGTVKDNFTTALDLSGLASGVYTLKVTHGSEYLMQQISIVK